MAAMPRRSCGRGRGAGGLPLDQANGGLVQWPGGNTTYLEGAWFYDYLVEAVRRRVARRAERRHGRAGSPTSRRPRSGASSSRASASLWREFQRELDGRAGARAAVRAVGRSAADGPWLLDVLAALRCQRHTGRLLPARPARVPEPADRRRRRPAAHSRRRPGVARARRSLRRPVPVGAPRTGVLRRARTARQRRLAQRPPGARPGERPGAAADERCPAPRARRVSRRPQARLRAGHRRGDARAGDLRRSRRSPTGSRVTASGCDGRTASEPAVPPSAPRGGRPTAAAWRSNGADWTGRPEIVVIDAGGGAVARCSPRRRDGRVMTPAWMPGRERRALRRGRGGEFQVYAASLAERQRPPGHGGGRGAPRSRTCRPTARLLVFVGVGPRGYDVYVQPWSAADWQVVSGDDQSPATAAAVQRRPRAVGHRRGTVLLAPVPTLLPRFWTPLADTADGDCGSGSGSEGPTSSLRHVYTFSALWRLRRGQRFGCPGRAARLVGQLRLRPLAADVHPVGLRQHVAARARAVGRPVARACRACGSRTSPRAWRCPSARCGAAQVVPGRFQRRGRHPVLRRRRRCVQRGAPGGSGRRSGAPGRSTAARRTAGRSAPRTAWPRR